MTKKTKPFLKWAGNKYHILDKILPLPEGTRYIEPFAGASAVFLNTEYPINIINDINPDLVNIYQALKNDGEHFIQEIEKIFSPMNNQEDRYYELRETFNLTSDPFERSILFLYLNRHGFNGLCRYNRKHEFNVPFGKYAKPYCPIKELRAFIAKLESCQTDFRNQDFRTILAEAGADDIVYCDPPYIPLSKTANFTSYNGEGFTHQDQLDLITLAKAARDRGARVFVSNHHTDLSIEMYKDAAKIITFDVQRYVSCKGTQRNKSPELLASF